MESSHLDDAIKKALEQFKAEGTDNWERMESLLNDSANADLSERAEDQILRNKLEELTPEMPAAHWALLNAQLTGMEGEEELEDVMLDGKAYESLNAFQAPYNTAHWPIMEEKIESSFSWRKRAVRYKVAELAILLLTFITILQYYPEAKKIIPKFKLQKPSIATPIASIPDADADINSESLTDLPSEVHELAHQSTEQIAANNFALDQPAASTNEDEFVSNIVRANSFSLFADMVNNKSKRATTNNNSSSLNNSSIIIEQDMVGAPNVSALDNKKLEAFPIIDFKAADPVEEDEFVSNIERANSFSLFADMVNNKSKRTTTNNNASDFNDSGVIIEQDQLGSPGVFALDNRKLEAFQIIDFKAADLGGFKNLPKLAVASAVPKFSRRGLRIGMYTVGSYDAVDNNPDDNDLLTRSTIGYGTGVSLGFKTGRWELESGLGYLSKSVKPFTPEAEVDQINLEDRKLAGDVWTGTQYDIIDIPVQIKFDFLQRSRWTAYIQSGASMNINQNIIYRYDQYIGGSGSDEQAALTPSGIEQENSKNAEAFDPTHVTTNVGTSTEALEFQSNASINWNIGFGLERALNRRYAAFLQTQYVHQLSLSRELGLEEESSIFRSPQLRLGVKATIFK